MPIRCAAIDDEPLALGLVKAYILKTPELQLVQVFEDAISAVEFLRASPVELIFVDIQMPDANGLELVAKLEPRPMVIFTTAHRKFAVEGFELRAVDYLLKPISFERFTAAVKKAEEVHRFRTEPVAEKEYLYVSSEYKLIRIDLQEIEYIESREDYVSIHLTSGKPVLTLSPLKKIQEKLPVGRFERIHRSYIVAVGKILSAGNKKVVLPSAALPVGDTYAEVLKKLRRS